VRELVEKEQACCAFLDFELSVDTDAVRLVVIAPEEAKDVAELLFGDLAPHGLSHLTTENQACPGH
jgi:hypothetical protein